MKPVNKQKLSNTTLTILGALFGVVGAGIFTYLWIEFGDRGIQADALHTSGYTTGLDVATAVLMVVLVAASAICFRRIKNMSYSYRSRLFFAIIIVMVAVFMITIVHAFTMQH
jgi:hypothetical protein